MKKAKKTPLMLALEKIVTAREFIDAELLAERSKEHTQGYNWRRSMTLSVVIDSLDFVIKEITNPEPSSQDL